ncbi:MAG: radical SAM protein [Archaeoglobaceae archaeon]
MRVVKPFDPWKSKLCSCKPKYSFNPYTGCVHNCAYCYVTYIPDFFNIREKKNLLKLLEKDLACLNPRSIISMSNSSDPYPPVEREKQLTRSCIELMKEYEVNLMVVTKSDIVARDLDILTEMNTVICITITGCDKLETNAPSTEKRIEAFLRAKDASIPTVLRFDPVIPEINEKELWIIEKCEPDHVVTSTLKLKRDAISRLQGYPELRNILTFYTEKVGSYRYLSREFREKLLRKIENFCLEIGISCGFCREGLEFKAKSCDGSHLFKFV